MDNKEETLPTPAQEDITFSSEDAEVNIKDSDAKKILFRSYIFHLQNYMVCTSQYTISNTIMKFPIHGLSPSLSIRFRI